MKFLRFIFFPFAIIYGSIVLIRNLMYSINWFRSTKFSVPTINVGNLSMGGTGKTPHVEYLIRLLKKSNNIATLSRGYGRKTQGFRMATEEDNSLTIGDEPFQYFRKFGSEINVAVDPKRVLGVVDIMRSKPETNCILLDDAFQHRSIEPGLNILLTTFNHPFASDFILPVGNLREFRKGRKRADLVIVTKCPNLKTLNEKEWRLKLKLRSEQPLFFSRINYGPIIFLKKDIEEIKDVILVTGIANSKPLKEYLESKFNVLHHFKFKDHHNFSTEDINSIHKIFDKFAGNKGVAILTTEKDAMRLLQPNLKDMLTNYPWAYQSIEIELNDPESFNKLVIDYVQETNRSN